MTDTEKSTDMPQNVEFCQAANSFVPGTFVHPTKNCSLTQQHPGGLLDLSQIPQYMTTCYPFISYDYSHSPSTADSWQAAECDQRMMATDAVRGSEQLSCYRDEWNVCTGPLLSSNILSSHQNVVAAAATGLTYQPPACSLWTGSLESSCKKDVSSVVLPWWNGSDHWIIPSADHVYVNKPHLSTSRQHPVKHKKKKSGSKWNMASVGIQYESSLQPGARSGTTRTVICKDCEIQTDFPEELSKLSLIERPSSLYCSNKTDLWEQVSETELTDADSAGYSCNLPYQLNAHPAISRGYLPFITHAGPLVIIPREPPPYMAQNDVDVVASAAERYNYDMMSDGRVHTAGWQYCKPAAVNSNEEHSHSVGECTSIRASQHCNSALHVGDDFSTQTHQQSSYAVGDVTKFSAESSKPGKQTVVTARECAKSHKKKQKRKAQLSRAADAELAEISLEQQVLREMTAMIMPLQQPTQDKVPHDVKQSSSSCQNHAVTSPDSPSNLEKANWCRLELSMLAASPLSDDSDGFGATLTSSGFSGQQYARTDSTKSSQSSSQCNGCGSAELSSPVSQTSPMTLSSLSPSPASSGMLSPTATWTVSQHTTFSKSQKVISKIHSRRFREYCNQVLSNEIDECCMQLLQSLVRFQDNMYQSSAAAMSSNASVKRRTVLGLREVAKNLKLSKLKAVIISPNVEKTQSKGGLDEALNAIIETCQQQRIPFVFALGRRALGRACAKPVPVSVVGIFNYDGVEACFTRLCQLTEKARRTYQDIVTALEHESQQDEAEQARSHDKSDSSQLTGPESVT